MFNAKIHNSIVVKYRLNYVAQLLMLALCIYMQCLAALIANCNCCKPLMYSFIGFRLLLFYCNKAFTVKRPGRYLCPTCYHRYNYSSLWHGY